MQNGGGETRPGGGKQRIMLRVVSSRGRCGNYHEHPGPATTGSSFSSSSSGLLAIALLVCSMASPDSAPREVRASVTATAIRASNSANSAIPCPSLRLCSSSFGSLLEVRSMSRSSWFNSLYSADRSSRLHLATGRYLLKKRVTGQFPPAPLSPRARKGVACGLSWPP